MPDGDVGFRFKILKVTTVNGKKGRSIYVTVYEYSSYRLQRRDGDFEQVHFCGRLTHEIIIDYYVRWEQNELYWIRLNQNILLVNTYANTLHTINNNKKRKI